MSQWYNASDEDIDLSAADREVNIYVHSDDWGSVYTTLSFSQIKKLCEQIEAIDPRFYDQAR